MEACFIGKGNRFQSTGDSRKMDLCWVKTTITTGNKSSSALDRAIWRGLLQKDSKPALLGPQLGNTFSKKHPVPGWGVWFSSSASLKHLLLLLPLYSSCRCLIPTHSESRGRFAVADGGWKSAARLVLFPVVSVWFDSSEAHRKYQCFMIFPVFLT